MLEALGGPRERIRTATAAGFAFDDVTAPVALAIEAVAEPGAIVLPRVAGLPDELFAHDGQLTKREIRAVTLSTLAPRGGELLWDIGAGAGSIGIEWLLAHPANRAIGIEARQDRLERARANALSLGVPHLDLRLGTAPDALKDLPTPDAIFVGGGASRDGVLDAAWQALPPGGRLVVNSVTLETEAMLIARQARHGGTLLRLSVERAGQRRRSQRLARRDAGGAMERDKMSRLVIGLGFRDAGHRAIHRRGAGARRRASRMPDAATLLAVVEDKAAHPALLAAVLASRYPVETVTADAMRQADARIATRSERVIRQRGVGSVCEATALAAAGASARLVVPRMVSADRTATAAAAMTEDVAP